MVAAHNIVTLESRSNISRQPAFLHSDGKFHHSPSFEQGIIDALRENPDVLIISEMRDRSYELTLNAAETGILFCHDALANWRSAEPLCMSFPSISRQDIRGSLRLFVG